MSGLVPIKGDRKADEDLGAMLDGLLDRSDRPSGKERRNSFDDSYSLEDSYSSSFGGAASPTAAGDSILGTVGRASTSGGGMGSEMYMHSPPSPNINAPVPAPAPAPSYSGRALEESGGGGDDAPFVPSFYDPSKSSRSRRGVVSGSRGKVGGRGEADELDELGKALAGSTSKRIVDPFSGAASSQRRGMSSVDNAMSRNRGNMSASKTMNMNLAASLDSDDSLDDMSMPIRSSSARTPQVAKSSTKSVTIAPLDEETNTNNDNNVFTRTSAAAEMAGKPRSAMKLDTSSPKTGVGRTTSGSPSTSPRASGGSSTGTAAGSPAWLPSSSAVAIEKAEAKKEAQIHVLQQKLGQSQLEREAVERNLRLEVEKLKAQLAASLSPDIDAAAVSGVAGSSQMSEYSTKLLKENADLKRTIAQLSSEVSRMKDESAVSANRHREEVKFLKDTAAAEANEVRRRHNDDLRALDKRQNEAVEALKKIHVAELEGMKKRSSESSALAQLTTQISSTSGSIKLIEEELRARYQAMELTKEGQFEARERLLSEMEAKARERAESAESEQYRLKGIMNHMEQVIANLRSDSIQEKERMRQEHVRLQAMQESVNAERAALQKRVDDELNMLQSRASTLETDARRSAEDKRIQDNAVVEGKRKLEGERAEFAAYIAASSRAAENTVAELRAEEERLNNIRADIGRERASFEQRKSECEQELRAAEERRYSLENAREAVNKERMELQRAARDLSASTTHLEQRSLEVQELENDLRQREKALDAGWKEMQRAGAQLSKRERDLMQSNKQLQVQHVALGQLDNELVQKQVELASSTRAALRNKREASQGLERRDYSELLLTMGNTNPALNPRNMNSSRSSNTSNNGDAVRDKRAVTAELNAARKALSHARHQLGIATHTKAITQSFIDDETLFLARMNSARSTSRT